MDFHRNSYGIAHSMDSIPCPYRFHMDSVPCPYGFHMDSIAIPEEQSLWTPYGIHSDSMVVHWNAIIIP
jgi:hypothetical protein